MPTLEQVKMIANVLFEEEYMYSEAYPVARWIKNGWPEVNDKTVFKLLDSMLLTLRLSAEYAKLHG